MQITNTAIELFAPVEAQKFDLLVRSLEEVRGHLEGVTVRSSKDVERIHSGLVECKRIAATVEEARKRQVGPLNAQVRALNDAWRPLTEALTAIEAAAKRKLLAWQQAERERVAREEEAARRAAEEAARREQEALAKAEAARSAAERRAALAEAESAGQALMQARSEEVAPAPGKIRSNQGTTASRFVWRFKVVDPAAVPREFLAVNEQAIRAAVAAGAREIPGVLIYEDEILATRIG